MSGSLNKVLLIGRLGRDPEIRSMSSGDKVANLSLATSSTWKDGSGQKQERTEWHRVVMFGKLADICERYLQKGSQIYVEGALRTRKWTDQSGNDRYSTEVVVSGYEGRMTMLGGGGGGEEISGGGGFGSSSSSGGGSYGGGVGNQGVGDVAGADGIDDDFDDDIPF